MFLAWGVLAPLAIGVTASCRSISLGSVIHGGEASVLPVAAGGGRTLWFQLDVALQTLGLALTAAGMVRVLSVFFFEGGEREGERERDRPREGERL